VSNAYYHRERAALLELFPRPPQRLLDVGCGAGATSVAARARWPGVETIGIEVVAEVAARAAQALDRVIVESAETIDLAALGVREIDGVLLADVLEHLTDPWGFLTRLRPALAPGAVIVASIPNIANLWVLEELAAGRFTYAAEGILDRTHLRFFTRRSIEELFAGAGYRIERWERTTDGRADDALRHRLLGILLPNPLAGWLRGRRVRLRCDSRTLADDFRTIQFAVVAVPGGDASACA
jgi:trans-aconitate methyltransferase